MNLAILQRMIREGDLSIQALRYLLDCKTECEWLDYKESLHLERDSDIAGFARDMLALRNVGGGYQVIGVRDRTWEPVGIREMLPYDSKLLRDKVIRGSGITLAIDMVQHTLSHPDGDRLYALLYVRSAVGRNRKRLPTLVKQGFRSREPYGLRTGDIYFRRGDQTVRLSSQEELEELLDAMEARADQAELEAASRSEAAFAVSVGTYRLLERGYETYIGREQLKNDLRASAKSMLA